MAKGVKKIKYVEGPVYSKMSVPNVRLTIKSDSWVWFEIAEWEAGTTAEDKKKSITWLRQSNDRKVIIAQMSIPSTNKYGVKLPKNLCGSYHYYIEASLSGKRDFRINTGLFVKGWCQPKIVSSKWCIKKGGDDVRKTYTFSYGHIIYLALYTEGLNGDKVTVEVYRVVKGGGGTKDDQFIYTYTGVEIIDGEVNLKIGNTFQWYSKIAKPKSKEEFYIKVKMASGVYVTDGKDDLHARFLRINNTIVSKEIEVSTNNTPTKVGVPNKNLKNTHLCKFEQITIEDHGEPFLVFKEGSTVLKKGTSQTQFSNFRVYFDFDQSVIRSDTKETLEYLLSFLLYNQHLDMMLSGHADDRGTLDYNQALSERRAKAVKDFFSNGGLDESRIKARGFGEVNPAVAGKTESAYKKNRRVEIDFSYLEYNQEAMVYETVAGSMDKPRNITVNILKRSDKACFRKDKHLKTEVIVNQLGVAKETKNGNAISYPIFSKQAEFPKNYAFLLGKFLNPFSTIYYPFGFHINSCAYYSDKNRAAVEVRVYPDVVWIGHFQYTGTETEMSYYFHQKKVDLEQGISDVIDRITSSTLFKITKILPSQWVMEHVVLEYIKKEAMSYFYGIHTIHNRTIEKKGEALSLVGKETNLIRDTQYTRYVAAAVIYGFVVIGILIDLLMIYLTRGKNLEGRVLKLSKAVKGAQKTIKALNDAGVEIIPPSIAINAGMYYQKQKDNRLALVYEANLKADPLVAIDYKEEFDLLSLLSKSIDGIKNAKHPKDAAVQKKLEKNKKNNSKIKEYFDSLGVSVKGSIEVKGELIFEHKVQYNFLTNSYSFTDKLGNLISNAYDEVIIKDQINFNAVVDGNWEGVFTFARLQTSIEGKVKFTLYGSAGVKLKYGVDAKQNRGLYVGQSLYCSGVEGTYYGSLEVKGILGIMKKETNNGKPTPFTLIEPFEVPLYKIELFKS